MKQTKKEQNPTQNLQSELSTVSAEHKSQFIRRVQSLDFCVCLVEHQNIEMKNKIYIKTHKKHTAQTRTRKAFTLCLAWMLLLLLFGYKTV